MVLVKIAKSGISVGDTLGWLPDLRELSVAELSKFQRRNAGAKRLPLKDVLETARN